MRKIDIRPFVVVINEPDGGKREVGYRFKESIIEILFNPNLKLNSVNLLKQDELAKKIMNAGEEELLLEEEEYIRVKAALDTIQGLTKNDVELVRRIINATEVEVKAK